MRRAYKFRLRPTKNQEAALSACLEDTRLLYNAALEERREAWRMGRTRITFYGQDAQLKGIRASDPARYGRWDSVPHPEVTRVYLAGIGHVRVHQHRAVEGRVKAGLALQEALDVP